jgi:hypothetical protein
MCACVIDKRTSLTQNSVKYNMQKFIVKSLKDKILHRLMKRQNLLQRSVFPE